MRQIVLMFLCLCFQNLHAQDDENILCSDAFCAKYLNDNGCPKLPDNCIIQNATHNGITLPFPGPCSCCPYCLGNLGEGDICAVGGDGSLVPDDICGPGLECIEGICVNMARLDSLNPCTRGQAEYDEMRRNGSLGIDQVRPNCDADGNYESYMCIPGQTCFCVDKKGTRIFGEIEYRDNAQFVLTCPCSRKYTDAVTIIGKELPPSKFFRCTENGDYDPIQCIDDDCMCVDTPDGAPTYPSAKVVKIEDISNKTLPCFDKKRHMEGKYFYECASIYVQILEETEEYKKKGYSTVYDFDLPQCTLDGKYAPVQRTASEYYCAYPDGGVIENYKVKVEEAVGMDCKCARSNLIVTYPEKPVCCPNGNFKKMQCKRGNCWCVDSNGYQKEKEVKQNEAQKLSCFSDPCNFSQADS